ncbi:unnamed protein product [Urochloa humidicola]
MAIPVARVHLAMAHAALPGLLPSPPKFTMLPLLPAPPCAAIILPRSPPRPSRADAAERWDEYKTKQGAGGSPTSPPSAGSPGRASSCEKWVNSNKKKSAGAATPCSSSSSSSSSRADSEERWDANKKPASAASSTSSASKNKGRGGSKRPNSRASSSSAAAGRWDAHKNGRRTASPAGELDDGESSTASNDVELGKVAQPPLRRTFYAGPGSPEPSMLPMPSFMIRVA